LASKLRATRIGNRIQEELANLLLRELSDERLKGILITGVNVDREIAYAEIFVSAIEGIQRAPSVLEALNHAQGFIRHELSQRIKLRSFPNLRFRWDATAEKAEHMEELFASLHNAENPSQTPPKEN
jgi:ribosome-binding factor A